MRVGSTPQRAKQRKQQQHSSCFPWVLVFLVWHTPQLTIATHSAVYKNWIYAMWVSLLEEVTSALEHKTGDFGLLPWLLVLCWSPVTQGVAMFLLSLLPSSKGEPANISLSPSTFQRINRHRFNNTHSQPLTQVGLFCCPFWIECTGTRDLENLNLFISKRVV